MKICVLNALKFEMFDFLKKSFLNLRSLTGVLGTLVCKTKKYTPTDEKT